MTESSKDKPYANFGVTPPQRQQPSLDVERLIGRLVIEHEMTKAIARATEAALRAEIERLTPIDKSTEPDPQSEAATDSRAQATGTG